MRARSALVSAFWAVALGAVGCHRAPAAALDAAPDGSAQLSASEASRGAVDAGTLDPEEARLRHLEDLGHPRPRPTSDAGPTVLVELTVDGPTEATDVRDVDRLLPRFVTCATKAVLADASTTTSPTLVVVIAENGDVLSVTLADPRAVSPVEGDCLVRRMMHASFDMGPPRTLRITVKRTREK